MADQASIFNGNNTPETQEQPGGGTPNVQLDPAIATLLSEIKNERGEPKYKTVNDAIIALKHSQEFIPQLTTKLSEKEAELNSLRENASKLSEIEKTIQTLTQRNDPAATPANGLTEEKIAELVSKTLSQRAQEATAATNLSEVTSIMQQKFGTEAEKVFYEKAKELGMSPEEVNALAARNPKAVLKLIGVDAVTKPNTGSPASSSFNTNGFTPQADTSIGRNTKSIMLGATAQDYKEEAVKSQKMVEELEAQGLSINSLTDPKVYFKLFK